MRSLLILNKLVLYPQKKQTTNLIILKTTEQNHQRRIEADPRIKHIFMHLKPQRTGG